MVSCPICQTAMSQTVCHFCGYDASLQYECCGSLSEINGSPMSLTGMRKNWLRQHKEMLICPACGGASFLFQKDKMTVRCCRCSVESEIPEILAMQQELSLLKEECSAGKDKLAALFSRVQLLYGELENVKADKEKLIVERNSMRRELSAEREKSEMLFTELQLLHGNLDNSKADKQRLIEECNTMRRELSAEREKSEKLFTNLQSLYGELETVKAENQKGKKQRK